MTYSNLWPNNGWSRRHLNWSLILYSWPALIPAYLVLFAVEESENGALLAFSIILIILAVLWGWYLAVWNLKHKGRSLWNLLYLLIPYVGGIVFLCVNNKDQLAKENAEKKEREKYQEEYWKQVEAERQDKKSL